MVDIKWVKFEVNMYDDTKLKIIDNMDGRDSVHYMWTRFLVLAGKINCGGHLYITDNMPYTIKTLAIEFNRSVDEVKTAIKVLKKLEMIEFTEDKAFKIKNWDKHQNVEGLERLRNLNNDRVAKHRAKKKETKDNIEDSINKNKEITTREDTSIDDIKENEDIATKEDINYSDEANEVLEKTNDIDNFHNSKFKEKPADNIDNNINDNCNVTSNDITSSCNITVMEQKKNENKKKMENKKEIENDTESNNIACNINNKGSINAGEAKQSNLSHDKKFKENPVAIAENHINSKAMELLNHYEKITGRIGGLNFGSVKLAIEMHGGKPVEMAINRALEVNKHDMPYINGILKNWRREGYPKEGDEIKNGARCTGKNNPADKKEFAEFKPKKPRNLTESERKGAEENLI